MKLAPGRAVAATLAVLISTVLSGLSPAHGAVDPAAYASGIQITAGTNAHSQVPITLTLPAPGDGARVDHVTFSWWQQVPAAWNDERASITMQTPECAPDQECVVSRSLTTATIHNGYTDVGLEVSDGTTTLGSTSFSLNVANPKPTATFTAPAVDNTVAWGNVTLSADASPGSGGVPLAGVRFYLRYGTSLGDPYVFDDTAPYSVQVPATDITDAGTQGQVYAIAEDVEGNLSRVGNDYPSTAVPMRRLVWVGPPAEVAFTAPAVDDVPTGSASVRPLLRWTAHVPDAVPASSNAYIKTVEVLIDGNPWVTMPYDEARWYNPSGDKVRDIDFGLWWEPAGGPPPGVHTALLRVTTNYGAVATTERRFTVSNGVDVGPVTDNGRVVNDGYVVTAGSSHVFTAAVHAKVPHSALLGWDLRNEAGSRIGGGNCGQGDWTTCPDDATITGTWVAPSAPGRYTLTWEAHDMYDPTDTITRTIVVESPPTSATSAAGRATARTTTPVLIRGHRARVTGRVVRADTGAGVPGATVRLQWRAAGTTSWRTLATVTTNQLGGASAQPRRRVTGTYRWVSNAVPGVVTAAVSNSVRVKVNG